MPFYYKTFVAVTLASFCSTSIAQVAEAETCSVGMTKFVNTPQNFDSILINPTCSAEGFFTTSKLAWTIEPVEDGEEAAIYSYPPGAVLATVDENMLIFDLNHMGDVPDKAGVVIQVPKMQLRDVTVDGVDNHVRIAPGFGNLLSIHSIGMSNIVEGHMLEWSKLIISADNSLHAITGEYLNFAMHSVSSKVYITGSVLGGEYDGFANEVYVTGPVRDLPISGNKNTLASGDCSEVLVQSSSSFCTILEEGEMPLTIPSIPCTFTACKRTCVASHYGYCHCTEEDCSESTASTVEGDENVVGGQLDEATSAASVASTSLLIVASAALVVFAV
jgi:uncharacterized Zn-binding protein involved in type VI secretion